jgi:hypothetical protein
MPHSVIVSNPTDNGFPVGVMPGVSEVQFNWLSYRMGLDDDNQACIVTNVDMTVVATWKEDPDFQYAYEKCLTNKREAFKYLVTQLNGKALRVIHELLDSPRTDARVRGLQLLMRAQGLLIDKQHTVDIDAVTRLVQSLRETEVIAPIPGPVGKK